jgi:hypothetical protein
LELTLSCEVRKVVLPVPPWTVVIATATAILEQCGYRRPRAVLEHYLTLILKTRGEAPRLVERFQSEDPTANSIPIRCRKRFTEMDHEQYSQQQH